MALKALTETDKRGFFDKLSDALESIIDTSPPVDIVEFCESTQYLNIALYPRQRLILKIYYKIPLTPDELIDTRNLLRGDNRYARMLFPGLWPAHADTLSDTELQDKLLNHYAHILLVIGGRRGSKSVLGSLIGAYEIYLLLRDSNPQKTWRVMPGQEIGIANVATDEQQALVLFRNLVNRVKDSPWFQRLPYRALETMLEFPGRGIYAQSWHSNSASVRGRTLKAAFLDEFAHFNKSGGKLSDDKMYAAIAPSVVTFQQWARIVIITSPVNKAGMVWKLYEDAERGGDRATLVFQLATWEMNPEITQEHADIQKFYRLDADMAEMEYGGQFSEQQGNFIPAEAVERCELSDAAIEMLGRDVPAVCHVDLAKNRDKAWLALGYYDKPRNKVTIAHCKLFGDDYYNEYGELDIGKVEEYILDLVERGFRFKWLSFDQFNSLSIIQRLREKGLDACELTFTEKLNQQIFGTLRTLIMGRGIEWYPEWEIGRQIKNLTRSIKKNGGFKVEAPLGYEDDLADCIAAVAYKALELAGGKQGTVYRVNLESAGGPGPALDTDPDGFVHAPGCDADACVAGCPVQAELFRRAKAARELG